MVDFRKLGGDTTSAKIIDPIELYQSLDRA